MSRKLISEERLVEIAAEKFDRSPLAHGCKISGFYKLELADAQGCNWSAGYFTNGTNPPEISKPAVESIIKELQNQFNIQN